ncbi:hypothetical protein ACOSQ3_017676 [Xanthoceras sorbifolium]
MHEQRIDQFNTSLQLNVSGASAHFVSNSGPNDRKGQRGGPNSKNRGGNRDRNSSRGGRFTRSNQRIYCQLCAKPGHNALQCYKRFDQGFPGPPPPTTQAHMAQQHNPATGDHNMCSQHPQQQFNGHNGMMYSGSVHQNLLNSVHMQIMQVINNSNGMWTVVPPTTSPSTYTICLCIQITEVIPNSW